MPRPTKIKYSLKKFVRKTTEGHCPYFHKPIKSIEAHVKAKHKGNKLIKRK